MSESKIVPPLLGQSLIVTFLCNDVHLPHMQTVNINAIFGVQCGSSLSDTWISPLVGKFKIRYLVL